MSKEKEFADPSNSLRESPDFVGESSTESESAQQGEPRQQSELSRESTQRRKLRLAIHWPVAAALMLFIVLVRQLPWTTFTYPEEVNNAWVLAMHHLLAQHAQCGRDFSFTFGPLGFCYSKAFLPQTYHWTLALWAVFALCQWFICYRISKKLFNNPLMALLWYAGLVVPLAVFSDVFFLAPAALMIVSYFCLDARSRTPSQETWLSAALLGLVAAVKFTFFICNGFVLALVAFDQMFRRRQFPLLALVALAVFLGAWVLCGQHIWLLKQYIVNSLEISRGHSEAMCLGEPQDLWLVWLFIGSAGTFLALLGARLYSTYRFWTVVPLVATSGFLFLVFKAAYVRQDWGHQVIAPSNFAFLLMLFLPVFLKQEGWRWIRQCAIALIVLMTFTTIPLNLKVQWFSYPIFAVKTLVLDSIENVPKIADFFGGNKQKLAKHREFMEKLKGPHSAQLAALKGGADCYPINCATVIANGMEYQPRPVVQSYCSYTKLLERQNADHLIGPNAPAWLILESMEPPDNWYPAANDGVSWLEFLRRYEPSDSNQDFLLLKKTGGARPLEPQLVKEAICEFGKPVEIEDSSDSSVVWVEIDVTPTAPGKLQNLFFRTFPPVLNVKLKDGSTHSYKVPSELLRSGFILSPFLARTNDLRHLYSDEWKNLLNKQKVVSFSVTDDHNRSSHQIYAPQYKMRLFKLSQIEPGSRAKE